MLRSVSPIVFCNMKGNGLRVVGSLCPGLHVITHSGIVHILNSRRRVTGTRRSVRLVHGRLTGCGVLGRRSVLSVIGNGRAGTSSIGNILMCDVDNQPVGDHDRGRRRLVRTCRGGSVVFTINPTKANGACLDVTLTIGTLGRGTVGGVVLSEPTMRTNRGLKFLPNSVGSGVSPCLRPLCSTLRSVVPTIGLRSVVRGRVVRVTPLTFVHKHALDSTIIVLSRTRGAASRRVEVFLAHVNVGAGVVVANSLARVSLPHRRQDKLGRTLGVLRKMRKVKIIGLKRGSVIQRGLMAHVIGTCSGCSGRETRTQRTRGAGWLWVGWGRDVGGGEFPFQ